MKVLIFILAIRKVADALLSLRAVIRAFTLSGYGAQSNLDTSGS